MTLKPVIRIRESSPRAEKRHFIDPSMKYYPLLILRDRHLNLLKEDLTGITDAAYNKYIVDPVPANPANAKSFYHAELERKLNVVDKDVNSMNIGRVSKNQIDSLLYVSSYQQAFNPEIASKLKFVKADDHLSHKEHEAVANGNQKSLYQESYHNDNSFQNTKVNKILNVDPHSFGKKNTLYHQYTPGVKVEQVIVLDPNKTVYKTSYENDYSERKFIKDIPPEQIPIPSTFGSKQNKRNMKFRKWGG